MEVQKPLLRVTKPVLRLWRKGMLGKQASSEYAVQLQAQVQLIY